MEIVNIIFFSPPGLVTARLYQQLLQRRDCTGAATHYIWFP